MTTLRLVYISVFCSIIFVARPFFGLADDGAARSSGAKSVVVSISVPSYCNLSRAEALASLDQTNQQLGNLATAVLSQIEDPRLPSSAKYPLFSLASTLHIYPAMDVMINDIAFVDDSDQSKAQAELSPLGESGQTAMVLLPNFGLPAFERIVDVISDRAAGVPYVAANSDYYAWVLWAIEGTQCATLRVEDAMAAAKDQKIRARYQRILDRLAEFKG